MTIRHSILSLSAAALVLPISALASPDCSKPTFSHEARACAAARMGSDDLRRFVQRTAKLYQLSYYDFAHAISPSGQAVADTGKGREQRLVAAKPRQAQQGA